MNGPAGSLFSAAELRRFHAWAMRLLAVATFAQGTQYVLAPSRPLTNSAFVALAPVGSAGWRGVGAVLALAAVFMAWRRTRTAALVLLGLVQVFLSVAQLVEGYVPSTLIIPAGLSMVAVSIAGDQRQTSRTKGGRQCG